MSVYKQLKELGVVEEAKFYEGELVDYNGNKLKRLFADITYKGNIITLYSEIPYSETPRDLAYALEKTFLHSVKLLDKQAVRSSTVFSKSEQSQPSYKEYTAYENIIYLPDGIYLCKNGWLGNKDKMKIAHELSSYCISQGSSEGQELELDYLQASKVLDFSDWKNMCKPISLYEMLIQKGAVTVEPLTFKESIEKVSGVMYGGRASLELNGITYYFKMWTHRASETSMTEDEAMENLELVGISISPTKHKELFGVESTRGADAPFDCNWHVLRHKFNIFLHPKGWFGYGDSAHTLEEEQNVVLNKIRIYGLEPELVTKLKELGFVQLI